MSTFSQDNLPESIPGQPPKFQPGRTSPLDRVAADAAAALRVKVQSAQEQRRAELLPAAIADAAPTFTRKPTPAPFTAETQVGTPPKPAAGGSAT
jgi:hypothetical protein